MVVSLLKLDVLSREGKFDSAQYCNGEAKNFKRLYTHAYDHSTAKNDAISALDDSEPQDVLVTRFFRDLNAELTSKEYHDSCPQS